MKKLGQIIAISSSCLALAVFFQNCGQPGSINLANNPLQNPTGIIGPEITDVYGIKVLPSEKFICEPFGNMNGGDIKGGLKAELAYVDPVLSLTSAVKNSYGSAEYFSDESQFIKTQTPLYFSQINVPTQRFDQGFKGSDGSVLKDTAGNTLIEWFALRMKSVLKLDAADEDGDYELATISDDGSRLFLGLAAGAPEVEVIKNDGAHSARMMCASEVLTLNKNSRIPMTYYYNQGPRTEIANVLIWRKKSSANAAAHELCGAVGQNLFWNPADSSEAAYWTRLKNDGWKIVDVKNFELPNSQVNPCATQNANLISKVQFSDLLNNSSTLNLDFVNSAQIKAKLFKVNGAVNNLIQAYDFSAQAKDKISLALPTLEMGGTYFIEVLLEMPSSGTQVVNEVRFQIIKK